MDIFLSTYRQIIALEQTFATTDLMRAYIDTTNTHGPSQALIDFIDYDKQFGNEIGVESFSNFSTQAQHELLVHKLDPIGLEAIQLGNMTDRVKKISNYLLAGGAAATVVAALKNPAWAGVGIVGLAGGILMRKHAGAEYPVTPYNNVVKMMKFLDAVVKRDEEFGKTIPKELNPSTQRKFMEVYSENYAKDKDAYEKSWDAIFEGLDEETDAGVPFDKSGWNEANFKQSVKWFANISKRIENLSIDYGRRFGHMVEQIDDIVGEDGKVSPEDKALMKSFHTAFIGVWDFDRYAKKLLKIIKTEIETVAHNFEIKK